MSEPNGPSFSASTACCPSLTANPRRRVRLRGVRIQTRLLLGAAAWVALAAHAAPVCAPPSASQPSVERLRAALADGRFVAYQPTSLTVIDGHPSHADPASIRDDLAVLRPRFDSLVTYGALHGAEAIPAAAVALNFRTLVVGVWNPFDPAEVDAAIAAARRYPRLVAGISLGNEPILAGRRSLEAMAGQVAAIRAQAPDIALTTTEPFHIFYPPAAQALLSRLDFLLVNVHPIYQPWFRTAPDANAARFVVRVVDELAQRYCGPILVKETGVPTGPKTAGFSVARQAAFYRELARALPSSPDRAFTYFVAFDAPWRVADAQATPGFHPEEAHWGLYTERRVPKPVIDAIPLLPAAAGR